MKTPTISVERLQQMLEKGQPVTILDVRPQQQREEWRIAESIYQDAYQPLINGDTGALENFTADPNIPVVTVCAAGKTSLIAAELLNAANYQAFSLEGGMKAWNYAYNTASLCSHDLEILQVRRVAKGCLSYIVGSGSQAMVVDASLDPKVYMDIAAQKGWEITAVADTHIHADYISRTRELAAATGAKHYFSDKAAVSFSFTPLGDGEHISIGPATVEAIFTPGHTPESTCFLINSEYLLTGDTLFTDGVGRPDLKADTEEAVSKANQLYGSLGKIKRLPGANNLIILPAHTATTIPFDKKVIGAELSSLLQGVELLQLEQENFVGQIMKRIPPTPPNYIQIANLNRLGNFEGFNPADLEAGANRCAVS